MGAAMNSVKRRILMQYGDAVRARLKAAQRCSDCVHLACGWHDDNTRVFSCLLGRFSGERWEGNEEELRGFLRAAASCDDFKLVEGE